MPILALPGVSKDVAAWVEWFQVSPFVSGILIGSGSTLVLLHVWDTRNRWAPSILAFFGRMPKPERKLRRSFETAPGAGKNAARLILRQRKVEDGEAILNTFMATPNRSDGAWVYAAQLRLRHELLGKSDGEKAWVEAAAVGQNGEWTRPEWDNAIDEIFGDARGDRIDPDSTSGQ